LPIVTVEYDDQVVSVKDINDLCSEIQHIVSTTTQIEDVPVYGRSAAIRVKSAPIEIFVQISSHKIKNLDSLMLEIKQKLADWKAMHSFKHPINLTIIPMNWKFEIGI